MAGGKRSNYMINMVINTVKSGTTAEIFHPCPFSGKFDLKNVTLKGEQLLSIYPTGTYRINLKIYDEIDDNILTVRVSFDLKT